MNKQQRGFTLIELIIVMVVTAIVVLMISAIINRPLTSYFDTQRRADLAERAQSAINRMTIELETPLPYSLRVSTSGKTLEFMPIVGLGRYRDSVGRKEIILKPNAPDDAFDSIGPPIPTGTNQGRVVVNNTSAATLYATAIGGTNSGVITTAANLLDVKPCIIDGKTDIDCDDGGGGFDPEVRLTLLSPHTFDQGGSGSPNKRFYIVNDAVTYHCDLAAGTVMRYQGYTLSDTQIEAPALLAAGTNTGLLSSGVTDCKFVVNPGSGTFRAPTVTVLLTVEKDGESATLVKEVQQWNAP
jgi:MSHA biogenesis protein MshO